MKRFWRFMLAEPELVVFAAAALITIVALMSGCSRSLRDQSAPCHHFTVSPDGKSWVFQGNRECMHDPTELFMESSHAETQR